jgi:hypothetical protein
MELFRIPKARQIISFITCCSLYIVIFTNSNSLSVISVRKEKPFRSFNLFTAEIIDVDVGCTLESLKLGRYKLTVDHST